MAALALVLLRLSVKGDSSCHRPHIDTENEDNCRGYVIKTLTLWTEMQCADSCLRLDFCDTYKFDQKESNPIDKCTLLSASVDRLISALGFTPRNVNRYEFQGQSDGCKTLRLSGGKNLRNYLLGTENCHELTGETPPPGNPRIKS